MSTRETGWVALTATDELPIDTVPVAEATQGVAKYATVALPYKPLSAAEEHTYAEQLQGAAGILLRSGYITDSLLSHLPDLQVVAVHGAGVDPVDVDACTRRGIWVTNTPGANANAVAELTLGLMLSLIRGIPGSAHAATFERAWDGARTLGGELRGRTLGVLGLGQIGAEVARLARAFGMDIVAFDPMLDASAIEKRGADAVSLEGLLVRSDVLSLHAPGIDSTRHIIGEDALAKMKPGALLINCARGSLVDECALAAGLSRGQLAGAALDVLDGEPPDPNSPLYDAPNVLITPHMAGSTTECLRTIADTAARDIVHVLTGQTPLHQVNDPSHPAP